MRPIAAADLQAGQTGAAAGSVASLAAAGDCLPRRLKVVSNGDREVHGLRLVSLFFASLVEFLRLTKFS